jgi:hypothetical protein
MNSYNCGGSRGHDACKGTRGVVRGEQGSGRGRVVHYHQLCVLDSFLAAVGTFDARHLSCFGVALCARRTAHVVVRLARLR